MWYRLLAILFLTVFILPLFGCQRGLSDQEVASYKAQMEAVVTSAKEAGAEAMGVLDVPLNVGMFNDITFGSRGRILVIVRVNPGE